MRTRLPEWVSGNIFIRPNPLDRTGDKVDGHQHHFDHTTIVFSGSVHVRAHKRYLTFTCAGCGTTFETRRVEATCPSCNSKTALTKVSQRDELIAERDFHAPDCFLVKADVEHEITALEDGTVFWCVYAHRDAQGRVTQDYTGWEKAYN